MAGVKDFNYDLAVRQARRVMEISEDVRRVSTDMIEPAREQASACWTGEAARRFIASLAEIADGARAEAEALYDLATRMRMVADTLQAFDAKALDVVSARLGR